MNFQLSKTATDIIVNDMIEKRLERVTKFGITFSTEKKESSLPTGMTTHDGKPIYIQAF